MILGIEAAHANKPDRTGVEEYCWQVINELKKIIPSTVRVILYSNEPLRGELGMLPANWEVKVLRWPLKKFWSQLRLSWEFLWHPPEVFFAPGQLVPFISPKKTVTTIHDSAFLVYPEAYRFIGRQYLRVMNWLILRRSLLIITSSKFNKEELKRLYLSKLDSKVKVIPLAYNQKQYNDAGLIEKKTTNLSGWQGITKPYIVSIGRLEKKKNTKRIIEAFNMIRASQGIQLVLIGKPGSGYDEVEKAIELSSYKEDIIRLGYLSASEIAGVINRARVFVFPSLYEGFGIPLLEAMAVGCPVVASRGSAMEEVGDSAVLYADPYNSSEIAEKITFLLNNTAECQELVSQGLRRVRKFSWQKTAEETWQKIAKLGTI